MPQVSINNTSQISPRSLSGQGIITLAAGTAKSITAANVVLSPGSVLFPATGKPLLSIGQLRVKLLGTATANLTVCWYGGPATATNGELILPGESRTVTLPNFASLIPSLFCTAIASVEIEW